MTRNKSAERRANMSTSKHTPGPWSVNFGFSDDGYPNYEIAGVSRSVTDAERAANARLIAAAPQLLEAAKFALLLREPVADNEEAHERFEHLMSKLLTAIAAAEGN